MSAKDTPWDDTGDIEFNVPADILQEGVIESAPTGTQGAKRRATKNGAGDDADLKKKVLFEVAGQVFDSASEKTKGFLSLYSNLDAVRPYFDVEPVDVGRRLLFSLAPRPGIKLDEQNNDLYGPLMLTFTLSAILLFGMKSSGVKVEQGTLIGTSFFICISYWVVGSVAYWFLGYLCSLQVSVVASLSATGYALFGYCVALLLDCLIASKYVSIGALTVFGGLSAATLGATFFSNIPQKRYKLPAAGVIALVHLLFLGYLLYMQARGSETSS